MYFPVRLDQKGRLYCTPNYLDYQANDLSKPLILLAEPGIIEKNNVDSIIFFYEKKPMELIITVVTLVKSLWMIKERELIER